MRRRPIKGKQAAATHVVWPIYFDKSKSRAQGRRVPRELAIKSPKLSELISVAQSLGLSAEVVEDAAYPTEPWYRQGIIVVEKREQKTNLLKKMAKALKKLR